MAPRVAGLPDPEDNIAPGAVMGVLPEAGETAHLQWEILKDIDDLNILLPGDW